MEKTALVEQGQSFMVTHMPRNSKGLNDAISRRRACCGQAPLVNEAQRHLLDQPVSPCCEPIEASGDRTVTLPPGGRERAG
jgi:hypothetical protein